MFSRDQLLESKRVSVWGIGYLGYTMLLRLQSYGFDADVVDLNCENIKMLKKGDYPSEAQMNAWTNRSYIPGLNTNRIDVLEAPEWLFRNPTRVHFICLPPNYRKQEYNENLIKIAQIFRENLRDCPVLVIFQSVSGPGSLERDFIGNLGEVAHLVYTACAFRSDWSIEEFLSEDSTQCISAINSEICENVRAFYELIEIETQFVETIRQAELLENSRNALEFHVGAFFNQLSLAYPDENLGRLTQRILKSARLNGYRPGLGLPGYRMPTAIDNLMRETEYPDHISLLRESASANLGCLYELLDFLKRQNLRSVLFLGVQEQGEMTLSPSLFLAEALALEGLSVFLHDPIEKRSKLDCILDKVAYLDFPHELPAQLDCLVVMTNHYCYQHVMQDMADKMIDGKVRLILDIQGAFSQLRFNESKYFRLGEGGLDLLE